MSMSFFGTIMAKKGCFMIGLLIFCTYWQLYQSYSSSETSWLEPFPGDTVSWEKYKMMFNKQYSNIEEEYNHYLMFIKNVEYIKAYNELYREGKVSYVESLNQGSDMQSFEVSMGYEDTNNS
ncbi:uncharacterized protein LOC142326838 [Lycorma delicatula]|uniref:uncharacterized protein LOC142326838 n=1 Tax=Lycorma delicatula TaxID=130591 RepID=UPI003F510E69